MGFTKADIYWLIGADCLLSQMWSPAERGGRVMTLEEMIKDSGLEPKTINKVIKDFQKAGEKYNGIQCAVAMTLLLRLLVQNDSQRQIVNDIANEYDIGTEEE